MIWMIVESFDFVDIQLPVFALLLQLIPNYKLLHLAWHSQRVIRHKFHVFRNFVKGNLLFAIVEDLALIQRTVIQIPHLNHCDWLLPELLVTDANDLGIENAVHLDQELLNLFGVDVLSASDNHILDASDYRKIPLFVNHSQISWFHPSVLYALLGGFFIFPVVEHHWPPTHTELSGLAWLALLSFAIDSLRLESW